MEGYLSQWINIVYRWKLRYFILHNGILVYCDKKDGAKKGSIHLQISSIILIPNDPLRIIINSGTKEINLRAKTISEKIKWVSALRNQQEDSFMNSSKRSLNGKAIMQNSLHSTKSKAQEMLTEVWTSQAKFDEAMADLATEKLPPSLVRKLQNVSDLASNLKKSVTLCAKFLNEEVAEGRNELSPIGQLKIIGSRENFEIDSDRDFDISDCVSMNSERESARDISGMENSSLYGVLQGGDPMKIVSIHSNFRNF